MDLTGISALVTRGASGIGDELASMVNSPVAVAVSKQLVREAAGRTEAEFWQYQKGPVATVVASPDAKEGPRAFAEKRAPVWSGG